MSVTVIGDSLTVQTVNRFPRWWKIRATSGYSVAESMSRIELQTDQAPDVMVLALGSNDVSDAVGKVALIQRIQAAEELMTGVPHVLWTTVKVRGVTNFYNPNWVRHAQNWNEIVRNRPIADWNAVSMDHPNWFLGDGLHLRDVGIANYAQCIRQAVKVVWQPTTLPPE